MARSHLTWRNPNTQFLASTTVACCTCGRRSEMQSASAGSGGKEWHASAGCAATGTGRPSTLEICRERDRRSPTSRRAARSAYEQKLRRTLERHFPNFKIAKLTGGVDLQKSFGPVYTRGV